MDEADIVPVPLDVDIISENMREGARTISNLSMVLHALDDVLAVREYDVVQVATDVFAFVKEADRLVFLARNIGRCLGAATNPSINGAQHGTAMRFNTTIQRICACYKNLSDIVRVDFNNHRLRLVTVCKVASQHESAPAAAEDFNDFDTGARWIQEQLLLAEWSKLTIVVRGMIRGLAHHIFVDHFDQDDMTWDSEILGEYSHRFGHDSTVSEISMLVTDIVKTEKTLRYKTVFRPGGAGSS